jgi:hypothetical protein
MAWPTAAVVTTNLDAGTDSPASARSDLLDAAQKLNQIIADPSGGAFLQAGTGAVSRTAQSKMRDVVGVKDFATGDGTTDDTVKIQALIDAYPNGADLIFAAGAYRHGQLNVTSPVRLIYSAGATVVPVFNAGSTEKLYNVTASDVHIDGLTIATVTGTISGNKYLVFADTGGDNLLVTRANISGVSMSDGNVGLTNLIVVHGVYLQNVDNAKVRDCVIDGISGAAVFANRVDGLEVKYNHFTDTGWYTVNLDYDVTNYDISHNVIDGTDVNARHWGGSINLMSQTTGGRNKRGRVHANSITGIHNYGAVIRALSAEDLEISLNWVYDCTNGDVGTDDDLQYIGLDRRGTAEGSPENGPCSNVQIAHNLLRAGTGTHLGIYAKNQYLATRDPHRNIIIEDNILYSPSSSANFRSGISVHGFKSGFSRVAIRGNACEVKTITGSPVGGGIGVVSTSALGSVDGLVITGNQVVDITTATPNDSVQVGVFIQATTGNGAVVRGNTLENFFYGVRTAASLGTILGLEDNNYVSCITDTLFSTTATSGGFNMSMGTALPVTGVFKVGHIRQKTDAAASASWGWVVTTAGGAMTAAWLTAQTYTAGTWYRNATGRVYELITAGGGTTSVEPSGTTVGADETGADGYVWRCRATTSARFATLPALGTVAALP